MSLVPGPGRGGLGDALAKATSSELDLSIDIHVAYVQVLDKV